MSVKGKKKKQEEHGLALNSLPVVDSRADSTNGSDAVGGGRGAGGSG